MQSEALNSIVPSINVASAAEAEERLSIALSLVPAGGFAHLDIHDGSMSPCVSWGSPREVQGVVARHPELSRLSLSAHLMTRDPESSVAEWFEAGVLRLTIHIESVRDPRYLLAQAGEFGGTITLALSPKLSPELLAPYIHSFSEFLVLAVSPGAAGQRFDEVALDHLTFLRGIAPRATLGVDGGITPETLRRSRAAGAEYFVSSSYIFDDPDPRLAYEHLRTA